MTIFHIIMAAFNLILMLATLFGWEPGAHLVAVAAFAGSSVAYMALAAR